MAWFYVCMYVEAKMVAALSNNRYSHINITYGFNSCALQLFRSDSTEFVVYVLFVKFQFIKRI